MGGDLRTIGYQTPIHSNDHTRSIDIAPFVRLGHRRGTMTAQGNKSLAGITVRRTEPCMMKNGEQEQHTGC